MMYVRLMINRVTRASFRRDEFFSRDFFEEREGRDDKKMKKGFNRGFLLVEKIRGSNVEILTGLG